MFIVIQRQHRGAGTRATLDFGEDRVKLTEENADYMDCRPLMEGEVNMDQVPGYLKERVEKAAAARREAGTIEGQPDAIMP